MQGLGGGRIIIMPYYFCLIVTRAVIRVKAAISRPSHTGIRPSARADCAPRERYWSEKEAARVYHYQRRRTYGHAATAFIAAIFTAGLDMNVATLYSAVRRATIRNTFSPTSQLQLPWKQVAGQFISRTFSLFRAEYWRRAHSPLAGPEFIYQRIMAITRHDTIRVEMSRGRRLLITR